jgi:hypothetical protein
MTQCRKRASVSTFVHIADERQAAGIRRSGLKLMHSIPVDAASSYGIFALPVVPNFLISHQWVRELKRRGFRVAVGVYFRVPDEQEVFAGLYNEEKEPMLAAQAASYLRNHATLGYEVIIPRSIAASDIEAIRPIPQKLGWRYFPGAHERGVFCWCRGCQRGSYKSRLKRVAYEADAH